MGKYWSDINLREDPCNPQDRPGTLPIFGRKMYGKAANCMKNHTQDAKTVFPPEYIG
jgi:hypothetical protein